MNLRAFFKRHLPTRQQLDGHPHLRRFGERMFDPDVWHLTRRSASGGAAVGVFCCFLPVPGQLLIAVPAAIALRVNVPITVAGVFISNPITMGPMLYACYRVGAWLLGEPVQPLNFRPSLAWISETLQHLWQPLFLGSVVMGLLGAGAAWLLVRGLWRLHLVNRWRARQARLREAARRIIERRRDQA